VALTLEDRRQEQLRVLDLLELLELSNVLSKLKFVKVLERMRLRFIRQ
jgi:hypothetical protein